MRASASDWIDDIEQQHTLRALATAATVSTTPIEKQDPHLG